MSEFTPAQLDALEDALEDLEWSGIPASLLESEDPGDADAVIRLERYRELLSLSREALPLQDVAPGVLDDVLAQARMAVTEDVAGVAAPTEAPRLPWWKRLRSVLLVPALAVAGSTALILWMVTPAADEAAEVASVEVSKRQPAATPADPERVADGRLADAAAAEAGEGARDPFGSEIGRAAGLAEPPQEGKDLARGRLLERNNADAPPPPAAPQQDEADDEGDRSIGYEPARRKAARPGSGSGSATKNPFDVPNTEKKAEEAKTPPPAKPAPVPTTPAPAPDPEPTSTKGGKAPATTPTVVDDPFETLQRADAARRAGACSKATSLYRQVRSDDDTKVQARALAGLGLCEEAAGNIDEAEALYRQARAIDAGVGTFIAAERPRDGAPKASKKK